MYIKSQMIPSLTEQVCTWRRPMIRGATM